MQGNPTIGTESFHEEIAELEAKLAAKKKELISSGIETPEKDIFKKVVREHATGESVNVIIPASTTSTSNSKQSDSASPAVTAKVNEFVAHAFTKGIASAVKEAKKTGDAYFIDLLHDRLADEYYEKLLQARKIQAN